MSTRQWCWVILIFYCAQSFKSWTLLVPLWTIISENKFCLIVGLQNMNIFSEWVKDGAFHRQYFTLASGCCYRSVWILCHDWHLTGALAFWAAGKAVTVNQSAAKHIGTVCYRDLLYNGNVHVLDRVRSSLTDHTHQHTDKHPHTKWKREWKPCCYLPDEYLKALFHQWWLT